MAKKMIIKGVGQMLGKRYKKDGTGVEVISLGSLQDLKFDLSTEIEDIFGGDGLFSIDTLVKTKSIDVSATDAKFDLDALQVMMGSTVQEGKKDYVWVLGEHGTVDDTGKYTVEYGDTLFTVPNMSVRLKDSNTLLKPVTTAPADKTEYKLDKATGVVEFFKDLAGQDVVVNYQRAETVDLVDILVDEVPFPIHIVHHGSFIQKDGNYAGVETEIYSAIAKGQFTIDAQRSNASTSQITLQVIDPERADGKIGSIKRFASTKRV